MLPMLNFILSKVPQSIIKCEVTEFVLIKIYAALFFTAFQTANLHQFFLLNCLKIQIKSSLMA